MSKPTLLQAILLFAYCAVTLTAVFAILVSASMGAQAQEIGPLNQTNETADAPTELYDQLFSLDVHSVSFDRTEQTGHIAHVSATWTGDQPTRVTVTQIPDDSRDIAFETVTLRPDERTNWTVNLVDDSDAILYTQESLNQGRALKLSNGNNWLITGPWDSTDAQLTGIAGLLAGLGVTAGLAYRRVRTDFDEPERIL